MCKHCGNIENMKLASEQADENLLTGFKEGGPFGAVIVKDGEVIAVGKNNVLAYHDPTAHAEVQAIRNACAELETHDLSGCEIYTSCYPCPMCLGAIMWSNIKTVYYGNTRQDADDIGFRDDFIYNTIYDIVASGEETVSNTVNLVPLGRGYTLPTFELFKAQNEKQLY